MAQDGISMAEKERAAVCGMGNALYGDDGIGPAFIRGAKGVGRKEDPDVLLLDCGNSPGLKLKEIISFSPSVVIIISAVDMGRGEGTVLLLEPAEAKKALLSSHKVDAEMFLRYLEGTLPARIFFIGVQPGKSSQGGIMGPAARNALTIVRRLADEILEEHGLRL